MSVKSDERGANADRIRMTLRLKKENYARLRDYAAETLAPHNRVVEKAVECFLSSRCKKVM